MTPSPSDVVSEAEVLLTRRGCAGIIRLNRPRQLNALTHGMVRAIQGALVNWQDDPAITRIVITAAGEKAFCAGGDIRALYDMGRAGRIAEALPFWREEYTLNHRLKTYPKPVVALINGIVMGGGVGVSLHGSHRVASEKLVFAMPEVSIGFFPDVGASHVLPRLKHHIGCYLALTGARLGLGDAIELGLATHAVAADRMAELSEALTEAEPVDSILKRFVMPAPEAPILAQANEIAALFGEPTLTALFARLSEAALRGSAFASQTLAILQAKSPTSLAIALEQMRLGVSMSFAEAMQMEFRIVSRIVQGADFYEGVRAVLIDKDQAPRWQPASIADLTDGAIAAHFAPLVDDLVLEQD